MLKRGILLLIYILVTLVLLVSCISNSEKPDNKPENDQQPSKVDDRDDPLAFFREAEDAEKAIEILEQLDVEMMDRDSRFLYYSLLISKNQLEKAKEQLELLMKEDENDIEVLSSYVTLLDYLNKDEERDVYLNKLLQIDPENSHAYYLKGMLFLNKRRYSEAEKMFKKSIDIDPLNANSHIGYGNSLMNIEGREEESVLAFNEAEKIDPQNPYIYNDRARVLRFLKYYGKAEDDLSKAISLNPSEWNYLDRARIRLSNLGDRDGAKKDLMNIVSINKYNFFANVYLAGIFDEEKEFDLSLEFYERILADKDDYFYAYPELGKLYYIKNEWEKAAQMYVKASLNIEDMTYPLMASLCFKLHGDDNRAKSILNEYISKVDRKSSVYEMYRYYISSSSPYFVQLAIDKEKNDLLRDRMKFYLAKKDMMNGLEDTAMVLFSEIADRKGAFEFVLASEELEKK